MASTTVKEQLLIDDRSTLTPATNIGSGWRLVSDQVMGGVSAGTLKFTRHLERSCLRLEGRVSTETMVAFSSLRSV